MPLDVLPLAPVAPSRAEPAQPAAAMPMEDSFARLLDDEEAPARPEPSRPESSRPESSRPESSRKAPPHRGSAKAEAASPHPAADRSESKADTGAEDAKAAEPSDAPAKAEADHPEEAESRDEPKLAEAAGETAVIAGLETPPAEPPPTVPPAALASTAPAATPAPLPPPPASGETLTTALAEPETAPSSPGDAAPPPALPPTPDKAAPQAQAPAAVLAVAADLVAAAADQTAAPSPVAAVAPEAGGDGPSVDEKTPDSLAATDAVLPRAKAAETPLAKTADAGLALEKPAPQPVPAAPPPQAPLQTAAETAVETVALTSSQAAVTTAGAEAQAAAAAPVDTPKSDRSSARAALKAAAPTSAAPPVRSDVAVSVQALASEPIAEETPVLPAAAVEAEVQPGQGGDIAAQPHVESAPEGGQPQPMTGQGASAPVHTASTLRATPETVGALATQIVRKLEARTSRFDIELDPAGLGKVNVTVEIGPRGQITAALAFERPQSAAELGARSNELRTALEKAGFDVASGGLSFQSGGGGAAGQNAENGSLWTTNVGGRAFDTASRTAEQADAGVRWPSARATAGGLDIRI